MAHLFSDIQQTVEISELRKLLDKFSRNSAIKIDELLKLCIEFGLDEKDEKLIERIQHFDENEDGMLDIKEFFSFILSHLQTGETNEELVEAFKVFDKDGTGFIDVHEMRLKMIHLGDKFTSDEIDQFIRKADLDGDGCINYEEFTKIMTDKIKFYEGNLFKENSERV